MHALNRRVVRVAHSERLLRLHNVRGSVPRVMVVVHNRGDERREDLLVGEVVAAAFEQQAVRCAGAARSSHCVQQIHRPVDDVRSVHRVVVRIGRKVPCLDRLDKAVEDRPPNGERLVDTEVNEVRHRDLVQRCAPVVLV